MADHRPDVYEDESTGKLIFRASSITRCSRSLVAAALDMEAQPPPDVMRVAWDEGSAAESALLDRFHAGSDGNWDPTGYTLKDGVKFKGLEVRALTSYKKRPDGEESFPYMHWSKVDDNQFTFEIPVGEKAVIRGHLDDICEVFQVPSGTPTGVVGCPVMGERAVGEAKFFGEDYWRKYLKVGLLGAEANGNEPFVDYAWQLSLYMHATGLPAYFVVGEKLRWHKMPDAEHVKRVEAWKEAHDGQLPPADRMWDIGRLHVTRFNSPLISLPKIKLRVMKLVKLIEARDLDQGCDRNQYPCAYTFLHDGVVEVTGKEGAGKPDPIVIEDVELAAKVRERALAYKGYTSQESDIKAKKKVLAAELDELLPRVEGQEPGTAGEWLAGDVVVEWVHSFTPGKTETKTVTTNDVTRSFPKITIKKKVEG